MNLQQFIDYRKLCPLCKSGLTTRLHFTRQQAIKYQEGRANIEVMLDATNKKQKKYVAHYSFGLEDNSFFVEFDGHYEHVPFFLRQRLINLHNNLKKTQFIFYRCCENGNCCNYNYESSPVIIDLRLSCYNPLEINLECFHLTQPVSGGNRMYGLYNYPTTRKSVLHVWMDEAIENSLSFHIGSISTVQLPLIPFISKEETTARLNDLIIFM